MASCRLPPSKKPDTCRIFSSGCVHGIYMRILCSVFILTGTWSCRTTVDTISDLDQHFHWAAILSYNAQFRHKCALHGWPLSTFDQQLYVTILDATVTKAAARRCFHCQRYDHKVINCPFPPGAPVEKEAMVKKAAQNQQGRGNFHQQQQHSSNRGAGSQIPAVYHQGREICIKYQLASCTFPNCRRAHICRHCKQEHPASECHPAGPIALQPR